MKEPSILIVEDEAPIREGLADALAREGYRVRVAATRAQGIEALESAPDLVLLDRRLPDGEGLDVLRALRSRGLPSAVIVLSARGLAEDRVEGLEVGADDYVTKPFHLRELVARVKAVLARGPREDGGAAREIHFGEHVLDVGARRLRRGRKDVSLTKLEFALLYYLATNPDRPIDRNELLDRVWGYDHYPTTRTVDFHVMQLRKKIERYEKPRHLVTVQGIGYRFIP